MVFRHNNICMGPALSSHYGATAGAAESVRAQIHSQSKLTPPTRENRKIRHANKLLNAKEPTPWCVERSDQSNDIKKTYHKISWDYPLNMLLYVTFNKYSTQLNSWSTVLIWYLRMWAGIRERHTCNGLMNSKNL
jgi:hypothetical protein